DEVRVVCDSCCEFAGSQVVEEDHVLTESGLEIPLPHPLGDSIADIGKAKSAEGYGKELPDSQVNKVQRQARKISTKLHEDANVLNDFPNVCGFGMEIQRKSAHFSR